MGHRPESRSEPSAKRMTAVRSIGGPPPSPHPLGRSGETLKSDLDYHEQFATPEHAKRTGSVVKKFCNRQRTPARFDYLSPVAFTQRYI